MRLEGSLDAFGLPDVLALLAMTRKTGALHLHREAGGETLDALVQVRDGLVAGVRADVHAQTLARRVLAAAPVDPGRLTRVVETVRGGADLVEALVEAGLVDAVTARRAAEDDVAESLAALLDWDDGSFAFEAVDDPAGPGEVAVSVDALVAAARNLPDTPDEPSAQVVLALAAGLDGDVTISPAEWPLLALVDGRRTVGEVVAVSGRSPRGVLADLRALLERGLLTGGPGGVDAAVARHLLLSSLEGTSRAPVVPSVVVLSPVHTPSVLTTYEEPVRGEPTPDAFTHRASRSDAQPVAFSAGPDGIVALAVAPLADPGVRDQDPTGDEAADPDATRALLLRLIAGVRGL